MLTRFKNIDYKKLEGFFKQNTKIVVIHFLPQTIRLLKVVFEDDERELLNVCTIDLPSDWDDYAWIDKTDKLAEFIKSNVDYKLFSGSETIAVLDTGITCIKELNMPILNEQELEQAIKWDALQYLPYNEDEYVYGYKAYNWSNNYGEGIKINLIATEQRVSDAVMAICSRLNLKLGKITVAALAFDELVQARYLNFAVLDIAKANAQVTIFEENRPVQNSAVDIGLDNFVALLAERLHVSVVQAKILMEDQAALLLALEENPELNEQVDSLIYELLKQVSMVIEKYLFDKPGQLLETVLIVGSLRALNDSLKKCLSTQLGIYAELIKPLDGFYIADTVNINLKEEEYAAAIGAALLLYKNDRFSLAALDNTLRPGFRLLKATLAICATLFIGLLVYESVLLYSCKADYQALSNNYEKIAVWRKRSELISSFETDCNRREQIVQGLQLESTAWPQVLLALGYSIPDGVSIISIVKVRDEDSYILRGKTEQIAYLQQFIASLQKTNAFRNVTLQQVNEGVMLNAHKEFTISLKGMGKMYAEANQVVEE